MKLFKKYKPGSIAANVIPIILVFVILAMGIKEYFALLIFLLTFFVCNLLLPENKRKRQSNFKGHITTSGVLKKINQPTSNWQT